MSSLYEAFLIVELSNFGRRKQVTPQAFRLLEPTNVEVLPPVTEGQSTITYQKQSRRAVATLAEMIIGDETAGKVYPGSMIWAEALSQDMRLDPLFLPKRSRPFRITVENAILKPGTPSSYDCDGTVDSFAAVFQAIIRNIESVQARIEVNRSEMLDSSTAMLELGLSASGWGASLAASLSQQRKQARSCVIISIKQAYFTLVCGLPPGTSYFDKAMFNDSEYGSRLIEFCKQKGEIGVVRRVTYGRRMLLSLTSASSKEELSIALKGRYSGGVAKMSADFTDIEKKVMQETDAVMTLIGGVPDPALVSPVAAPAMEVIQKISEYLGRSIDMSTATSAAVIGFEAEYAYDRAGILKADATNFSEQIPKSRQQTLDSARISFDSSYAVLVAGDTEIHTDDWTWVNVSYRLDLASDGSGVSVLVVFDAREGNKDKSFGDTWFRIRGSKLIQFPGLSGRRVVSIVDPTSGSLPYWFSGERHGTQVLQDFGALCDIRVAFDEGGTDGRKDLGKMNISFTVRQTVMIE